MKLNLLFGALALAGLVGTASGAATLTHDYQLNGTLADSLGGPALVAAGGSIGGTGYTFGANQGLSLSNGLASNGDYSIEMKFSFDQIGGFRKILDFKNQTSDNGLYALGSQLNFYNFATGGSGFSNGAMVDVILTRDGGSNGVVGYLNGAPAISFGDTGLDAIFNAANDVVQFFKDDFVTGGGESSSGFADYIRVYTGVVDGNQAACLSSGGTTGACGIPGGGNNVPEPGTLALLGIAALAAGLRRRR